MAQVGIALDDIVQIADFQGATLLALAARVESSTSFQALIAREIELDELWRRVDTARKTVADDVAAQDARRTLDAVFSLVWQAHDLAGAGQATEAAARLCEAAALWTDANGPSVSQS